MREDFASLESFILEKIRESRTPGLSIGIVSKDETIYCRGFGFSDISSGVAATPRTLFGIGSVTRSFTALAIMQLAEEGKLKLDDPIAKHTGLKLKPFGEEVRVHHLLTHSSGIPALGYGEAFINGVLGLDNSWLPISSPEDVISFMRDAESWAVCKPGERFFYLNEGFVLLGYIISKLTGRSYEDYVKKRILKPLGMNRTFFSKTEVERDRDKATPYIIDKEGKHIASGVPYGINADGGMISNVLDLLNYLRMYINQGEFKGRRIAGRKSLVAMEQPYVKEPYEIFGKEAYGYGWGITPNFCGNKLVGHSGSVGVYTAYVGFLPEKKIGVAVLANPGAYSLSNIGMYALAQLIGADPEKLPFIKTDKILAKLEGQYETYKGTIKINIKKKAELLHAEIKDKYTEQVSPLIPEKLEQNRATFYTISDGIKMPVEFNVKDKEIELIVERYKLTKSYKP
jgi:CubicO group peptidase (beta-lactamase class C family)